MVAVKAVREIDMLTGPVAAARAVVATGAWVKSKHDMHLICGSVGALFLPIRRRITKKKKKNRRTHTPTPPNKTLRPFGASGVPTAHFLPLAAVGNTIMPRNFRFPQVPLPFSPPFFLFAIL